LGGIAMIRVPAPWASSVGARHRFFGVSSVAYGVGDLPLIVSMITKRKIELNNPTDAAIVPAIVGSGIAILLSLISIAVEKAQLPGLLSLCLLAAVENLFFPMISSRSRVNPSAEFSNQILVGSGLRDTCQASRTIPPF
jgi:hypothetical protein